MNLSPQLHVLIVFNEPNQSKELEYKQLLERIQESQFGSFMRDIGKTPGEIDLSEVGILDAVAQVKEAIEKSGCRVSLYGAGSNIATFDDYVLDHKPDIIFNLCESLRDRAIHEMHMVGFFELLGIPYTGSPPLTLGTCLQKNRAKEILSSCGIPTPKFQMYYSAEDVKADKFNLRFPVIAKPAHEDASAGIDNNSIIGNVALLRERVRYLQTTFKQPVIVEEFIDGRELNVAILGNNDPTVLPLSEIDFSSLPEGLPKIVTFKAKWVENSPEYIGTVGLCPAVLPEEVEAEVKKLAVRAYKEMGCQDYARIDVRLSKDFKPYVLEVNPNPDISDGAGFARSARASGLEYADMIVRILEVALMRTGLRK